MKRFINIILKSVLYIWILLSIIVIYFTVDRFVNPHVKGISNVDLKLYLKITIVVLASIILLRIILMDWNNRVNQFKKILFFLLFLCIGVSLYYQVKFEKYISNQKKAYNILQNRERISFIPVAFYYMKSRNDRDRCLNRLSQDLIYEESNISTRRIIMGYDEYIMACFYNKNEKLNYINSQSKIKSRFNNCVEELK